MVAISAGVFYSRGEAFTDVVSVEIAFIPEIMPVFLAQAEPEPVIEPAPLKEIEPEIETLDIPDPVPPEALEPEPVREPPPQQVEKKVVPPIKTEPVKPQPAVRAASLRSAKAGVMPYSYRQLLIRHIERHKYYPASARRRALEGKATVAFQLSRQGDLRSSKLIKTSGYQILDKAALQTLQQASPFPAPPGTFKVPDLAFQLPVQYSLKK